MRRRSKASSCGSGDASTSRTRSERCYAARALGIDDDAIRRGLESVRGVPGRFESVDAGQPFHVIVDYAHKPGRAREGAARGARARGRTSRVLCVVGAGGDRDRGKRAGDGAARVGARRRGDRDLRQPAQRGSGGDRRRDRVRRGQARSRSSSIGPRRSGGRSSSRRAGRRRPHRRQGGRAGSGVRGSNRSRSTTARPRRERSEGVGGADLIPLPLAEVRALSLGRLEGDADAVTGVHVDSRLIEPGDLFVAVAGGEAFLEDARARGAAATLVPDDAHAALAALGSAVRARSDARVVAITGSVGKTSTKDILGGAPCARICAPSRRRDGFNNEIGLPLTLCRIEPETEVVVTEMAMRGPGQIRDLARVARPRARRDHVDRARASRAAGQPREHRARQGGAARRAARPARSPCSRRTRRSSSRSCRTGSTCAASASPRRRFATAARTCAGTDARSCSASRRVIRPRTRRRR